MRIEVRGSSDDTFGVYGTGLWPPGVDDDHDDCANMTLRAVKLTASTGRMMVCGQYGKMPGGTWFIGVAQAEEDEPLPPWAMEWRFDGYTPVLAIQAPNDCRAEWYKVPQPSR